jgi:hypothetical protein
MNSFLKGRQSNVNSNAKTVSRPTSAADSLEDIKTKIAAAESILQTVNEIIVLVENLKRLVLLSDFCVGSFEEKHSYQDAIDKLLDDISTTLSSQNQQAIKVAAATPLMIGVPNITLDYLGLNNKIDVVRQSLYGSSLFSGNPQATHDSAADAGIRTDEQRRLIEYSSVYQQFISMLEKYVNRNIVDGRSPISASITTPAQLADALNEVAKSPSLPALSPEAIEMVSKVHSGSFVDFLLDIGNFKTTFQNVQICDTPLDRLELIKQRLKLFISRSSRLADQLVCIEHVADTQSSDLRDAAKELQKLTMMNVLKDAALSMLTEKGQAPASLLELLK